MKFSIITPSLNQGKFIEDTILSVVNQNYPDFEHIVMDGGSTDETVSILKKYSHLKWISEKDSGQSNALNNGFRLATGDICAWINSDDYYDEGTFQRVAEYFTQNKDCMFVYGDMTNIDADKNITAKLVGDVMSRSELLKLPDIVRQPSCFWRRSIFDKVGYLNENLHLVFDYEFFLRITKYYTFHYLNKNMCFFRIYADTKTQRLLNKQFHELKRIMLSNFFELKPVSFKFLLGRYLDSIDESRVAHKLLTPLRKGKTQ